MSRYLVLTALLVIAGCSGGAQTEEQVQKEIRDLLPEAASLPAKELESIKKSFSKGEEPEKLIGSLTTIVALEPITLKPGDIKGREAHKKDFRFLHPDLNFEKDESPQPAKIAKALTKVYADLARSKNKGYATCLQPENITDLTCKVKGKIATGVVSFKSKGLYEGRVEYSARRGGKGWWIEEFRLPGHQIKLSRKSAKDKWQQTRVAE